LGRLGFDPQGDRSMVKTQVTSYPTQVHPIHIQLEGFSAHFFGIGPWFGVGRVLDLAKHATIALAATVGFPSSVLAFCAMTFGTLDHAYIIAQVLATPKYIAPGTLSE
jgi:hypothetical protein